MFRLLALAIALFAALPASRAHAWDMQQCPGYEQSSPPLSPTCGRQFQFCADYAIIPLDLVTLTWSEGPSRSAEDIDALMGLYGGSYSKDLRVLNGLADPEAASTIVARAFDWARTNPDSAANRKRLMPGRVIARCMRDGSIVFLDGTP